MTQRKENPEIVIAARAELDQAVERRRQNAAGAGPILVEPAALRAMEHVGLFAAISVNPNGPAVETVSLASFDGQWDEGGTVLLRRSLHPYCADRVQVLATEAQFYEDLISIFVANNGRTAGSVSWASPFLAAVPTGLVVPPTGAHLAPHLRLAFRYLFRDHDDMLIQDVRLQPKVVDELHQDAFPESPAFTRWWDTVIDQGRQNKSYTAIHGAWVDATRQDPDRVDPTWQREPGEFHAWWRLFDPK